MRLDVVRASVAAAFLVGGTAHAVVPLPRLTVDPAQITVSGLSSGGFMANQLGIAYSSTFRGVGVFAGGPYMCAGHSHYTACMYNATISASMLSTMQADIDAWSGGAIDAKSNIAAQKVFLFVGTSDTTVGPNPMNAVQAQYTNNGVPAASLDYVKRTGAAHVFPTDFDAAGDNACNTAASPYIANCGYDGAKAALTKFYGALYPRNDAPAAGNYVEFDQTAFTANPGMAATGWIYVPADCAAGATCRLHVALHGCLQNAATIGDKFLKSTGYTRWADTNRIVVLFPQTRVDNTSRPTAASGSLANPNGCWDWIGWYGGSFAQKAGTQMAAIKAMVDRVASGGTGSGTLPAPSGVATSGATSTSMVVSWSAVNGASGYNVYRGASKVNAAKVTGTSYTDTGLAPGTTYSWTVTSLDASNAESAPSAPATGTTTGAAPACFTASNYAHTQAGRAHQSGGYAYANGSNQNMGLWNTFFTTTLKQTGSNYYVIGTCS
jgi:poly(3-hydroxybutyrate) depolymerase